MSSAPATVITLPNNWAPRDYQLRAWAKLRKGIRFLLLIWHRRAGKDDLCLHWTARAAHERIGGYWHMLPEASQARKAIWAAVNPKTGKRRIDEAFPKELRKRTVDDEMFIEFKNGSTWQVVGSDNFDSLVGSSPAGVVFSEWALAKPTAWGMISPILLENDGWALFITTARGRNHAYRMLEGARDDPAWYTEVLPATVTGVFTPAQLAAAKADLIRLYGLSIGLAMYNQEYLCSFSEPVIGSIYAAEMSKMREEGRICSVPYDKSRPVIAAHDLGKTDSTAIWFLQQVGQEIHWIDYHEDTGKDPAHYCDIIQKKQYRIGEIILPHDAKASLLGAPVTAEQTYVSHFGRDRVRVLPNTSILDGINTLRAMLARSWMDERKCAQGIDCWENYRYKWDEDKRDFSKEPLHDWSSHGSDAGRYAAVSMLTKRGNVVALPQARVHKQVWNTQLGAR